MNRKKRWTFESICRAARRGRKWRVTRGGDIRCEDGRCPLGAVFPGLGKIPWGKIKGVPARTADAIVNAADRRHWWQPLVRSRPRMLKLLGIKAPGLTKEDH